MNPFAQQLLGSFARVAIVWAAAQAGHDLTDEQAMKVFLQYVVPISVFLWSVWQKYQSRKKLVAAMALPKVVSEHELEQRIAMAPSPSAWTNKKEVPQ